MNGNGRNENPSLGGAGAGADLSANNPGGGSAPSLPRPPVPVKKEPGRLLDQAGAAELRAEATAAWHRERAARYLGWCDLPWCAAQYAAHAREAQYQDALAARHRSIAASLQGVRHG